MSVKSIFKDSVAVVLLRFEAHSTIRDAVLPVSAKSVVTWSQDHDGTLPHVAVISDCIVSGHWEEIAQVESYSGDVNGHQGSLLPALAVCPSSWSPH